jgi:hypothetical protein
MGGLRVVALEGFRRRWEDTIHLFEPTLRASRSALHEVLIGELMILDARSWNEMLIEAVRSDLHQRKFILQIH